MSQSSGELENISQEFSSSAESFNAGETVEGDEAAVKPLQWRTDPRSFWWPVCNSSMLPPPDCQTSRGHPGHRPHSLRLLGLPLVVYRQPNGQPACLEDRCPHKNTRLSTGRVINGTLQCFYHGWNFAPDTGKVSLNPTSYSRLKCRDCPDFDRTTGCKKHHTRSEGHSKTPRACTKAYPCEEKQGFVWVWIGSEEPDPSQIPDIKIRDDYQAGKLYGRSYILELPIDARLFLENLGDTAHVPFVHHQSFARWEPRVHYHATLEVGKDGVSTYIDHDLPTVEPRFELQFFPPATSVVLLHEGHGTFTHMVFHTIPTGPGHCRIIFTEYRNHGFIRYLMTKTEGPHPVDMLINNQDFIALSGQQQILTEGGVVDHLVKQDEVGAIIKRWYVAAFTDDAWWKGWDGKMTPEKLRKICDDEQPPNALFQKASQSRDGRYLFDYVVKREDPIGMLPFSKETALKCSLGLAALVAGCMCFSTVACRLQRSFR